VTTGGGPGLQTTNIAFLIYSQALIQFDVGNASGRRTGCGRDRQYRAFFLVRIIRTESGGVSMASQSDLKTRVVSTVAAWFFGFLIFLPILWMALTSFQTELEAFSMPPKFLFFHWRPRRTMRRCRSAAILSSRASTRSSLRRVDADRHADRCSGRLVDGHLRRRSGPRMSSLDALDQDDAAVRRSGSDLSDLPRFSDCSIRARAWSSSCSWHLPSASGCSSPMSRSSQDIREAARM